MTIETASGRHECDSFPGLLAEAGSGVLGLSVGSYRTPFLMTRSTTHTHEVEHIPPPAREPVHAVTEKLFKKFIEPALRTASADAYTDFLRDHTSEIDETMRSLRVVIASMSSEERAEDVARVAVADLMRMLREPAVRLAGVGADDEVEFAMQTYERAGEIIARFRDLPLPESAREQDRDLARQFAAYSFVHSVALLSLVAACEGVETSASVVERVFDYLRQGAILTYSTARLALDLRQPADVQLDLEPIEALDADDYALADATLEDVDAIERATSR